MIATLVVHFYCRLDEIDSVTFSSVSKPMLASLLGHDQAWPGPPYKFPASLSTICQHSFAPLQVKIRSSAGLEFQTCTLYITATLHDIRCTCMYVDIHDINTILTSCDSWFGIPFHFSVWSSRQLTWPSANCKHQPLTCSSKDPRDYSNGTASWPAQPDHFVTRPAKQLIWLHRLCVHRWLIEY